MAAPTLSHTAERLYDALEPLADGDESRDWPLAHFCAALARQLDDIADLSRDDEDADRPGWAIILDPDDCPAEWLPWLAQFVGVQIPAGLDETQARARLKSTDGFRRGTPDAIKGAARQFLTGAQRVFLTERHASRWRLTVTTFTSETPDPAKVLAALMEQKPAGIILVHSVVTGGDFNSLRDTHTDFADIAATYTDFNAARDNPTL